MNVKRISAITATVIVVAVAVTYHFLIGYAVEEHPDEFVKILQRKNLFHQIGANVIAYTDSKETIVVDTQLRPLAQKTRSYIESVSNNPISKVLVTHWHPDHSGGIGVYSADTEIIAHTNVLLRLSEPQEGFGLTNPGSHHQFPPRAADGLPSDTVDSLFDFQVNSTTVSVVHYPNAHTDGDLVIFFHGSQIVAIGDLIWPKSFPFIDVHNGGSVAGLESSLEAIIESSKATYRFIPGHGPILTLEDVVEYRQMVAQTRQWVELQLDEGRSVDEIIESGLPATWDQWASRLVPAEAWIRMIADSRTAPGELAPQSGTR